MERLIERWREMLTKFNGARKNVNSRLGDNDGCFTVGRIVDSHSTHGQEFFRGFAVLRMRQRLSAIIVVAVLPLRILLHVSGVEAINIGNVASARRGPSPVRGSRRDLVRILTNSSTPYSNAEKDRPEKGNPECDDYWWSYQGNNGTSLPCRDPVADAEQLPGEGGVGGSDGDGIEGEDSGENGEGIVTQAPSDTDFGGSDGPTGVSTVSNDVQITLYAALRPRQPSVGHTIIWVTTHFLNTTMAKDNYMFAIPQRQDNDGNLDDRSLLSTNNTRAQVAGFLLIHDYTSSKVVHKRESRWWWQYNITYHCYWPEGTEAVTDASILSSVDQQIKDVLFSAINSRLFQQWMDDETHDDFIQVWYSFHQIEGATAEPPVDENPIPSPPQTPIGKPTQAPSISDGKLRDVGSFTTPLDQKDWDWRRYLGLGLFVGTLFGTLVLTQLAAYRHRLITRKEYWGNIGTERGVNEILNLGWKVRGGNLEVYDKAGVGYRDDDSILIGGYEQKQVVGAEITVTLPSSETTPDKTHGS